MGIVDFIIDKWKENKTMTIKQTAIGALAFFVVIAGLMFGLPQYKVWQQAKEGEATLAKAEQDRQIAILEARAKKESAEALAEAEIIRAKGIAEANEIIGGSLNNNEAYLRWLWIDNLKEFKGHVIYVPTEAGIPITESQRFKTENK